MNGRPPAILGQFLIRICGFAEVLVITRNANDLRVPMGEEPLLFPYRWRQIEKMSPNVPKWAEAPTTVGFCDGFLESDYLTNFRIDVTKGMEMGYNVLKSAQKGKVMRKTREIPINMRELVEEWAAEVRPAKTREKKARHAVRLICRALEYQDPQDCTLGEFPSSRAALKSIPRIMEPLQNDAGFRSLISAAMNVVRFGLEKGWLAQPTSAGQALGFPYYYIEGRSGSEWNRTQWVWNRMVAFAAGNNRRFDKLDHQFLLSFFKTIIQERGGDLGRRDLRWFIGTVRADADAGVLPDIDLPDLPTNRPQEYALPLEDWPAKFQPGITAIREWLTGEIVDGRTRKKRVRPVSAERDQKHLELFGGYISNIYGPKLATLGWDSLFDPDRVLGFLLFTDPDAQENDKDGQILTGIYQEGLLNTFIKFAEGPLRLPSEAKRLADLRFRFLFERKRTGPPKELTPDTFFRCAAKLIDRARETDSRGQRLTAATYRRDALLVALMGLYPRRTDTAHRITIDEHLILREGDPPKIAIPREDTKPEKRDSILEVPEEIAPLFRRYLDEDRPLILGGRSQDHKAFFVSQGGTPFCAGNARTIVRRRMNEEMGMNVGPHSARHVWTPRFLLWSHGDYLSAMAVLDTNMDHIERAYRDAQQTERAAGYFKNTERRWKEVEDERRNGNGKQNTHPSI